MSGLTSYIVHTDNAAQQCTLLTRRSIHVQFFFSANRPLILAKRFAAFYLRYGLQSIALESWFGVFPLFGRLECVHSASHLARSDVSVKEKASARTKKPANGQISV